jgi:hypothetical protein
MSEHVVLVAFSVEADSMEAAQYRLMDKLTDVTRNNSAVTEWWVAEDERYDRSDNEAAVFVPEGLNKVRARQLLEEYIRHIDRGEHLR